VELDLQVDVAQKNHAEIEENYPSDRHSMLTFATQIQSMAQWYLTTESCFPEILDLFQGLKIRVPSCCLEDTSTFKIITIDDVNLWSKLESTW